MNHTKGPWKTHFKSNEKNEIKSIQILQDSKAVSDIFVAEIDLSSLTHKRIKTRHCDAQLIAAAPEMLEALETLLLLYTSPDRNNLGRDVLSANQWSAFEDVKILIRKAVSYTHLTLPTIYSV